MKTCLFCPNRADSAEHVYPQWMSRRYLNGAGQRASFTMRFGGLFPERVTRTLNQTVKVCSQCNNGWMSRLEEDAKPLLEKLATGQPLALLEADQAAVSKWLCKNAVLHDHLQPSHQRLVAPEQRAEVASGHLPDGWQVHLGMIDDGDSTWSHTMGAQIVWQWDDGSHRGKCQLHTTAWERMVAQVLVHTLDVTPTFDALLGGSAFSVQIAPWHGVTAWPPPTAFTSDWLEVVSHPATREF